MPGLQSTTPLRNNIQKPSLRLPSLHISPRGVTLDSRAKLDAKFSNKGTDSLGSLVASTNASTNSISSLEKPTISLSWDRNATLSKNAFNKTFMTKNVFNQTLMPIPKKIEVNPERQPRARKVTRKGTFKFRGVWDVYQDNWFDIQSRSLNPLFMELPTPSKMVPGSPKFQQLPVINQAQPKSIRPRARKVVNLEMYLRTCDACNTKKKKGVQLRCYHFVCKECLQSHIKKQIELEKVPIRCPRAGCKYQLDHQDINKHAATTELVKRHYELCVSSYVQKNPHQLVQCYTQGCGYVINLGKLKQKDQLDCPRCKKVYCIRCHKLAHGNRPCDENL